MKKTWVIFIIIYLIGFGIVFGYAMTHPIVNDGVMEYNEYAANIQEGWKYRYSLVNSSLVTTWLPAMIQRLTNIDQIFIFKLIPALFYPLMPAFTFLIAKRYLNYKYAVVAVLIVLLSSYFIFFPSMGRVGAALGFLAGILWALLNRRLFFAITCSILLVFSHYGTSLIALCLILGVILGYLIWKRKILLQFVAVFSVLVVLFGIWNFGIAHYSGEIIAQTVGQEQVGQILPANPDLFNITNRESAVLSAIGLVPITSIPQLLEIIANWIMVILFSLGLLFILRDKKIESQFKLMALAFFSSILLTIAIPVLSIYYNGMRVYFTSTIVLALGFPLVVDKIAKIVHINPLILCGVFLLFYGLSTSGLIYLPFGLHKVFPVEVSIP